MTSRTLFASVLACSTLGAPSPQATDPAPAPPRGDMVWGDLDGDGLLDAVVIAPGAADRLLHNLGDGSFRDVSLDAGLPAGSSSEARWQDVDEDGDPDLLLVGSRPRTRLVLNEGGVLRDATAESGLAALPGERAAAFLDYDLDGLPDLAVSGELGTRLYRNLGGALFEPVPLGELVRASESEAPPWVVAPEEPGSSFDGSTPVSGGSPRAAEGDDAPRPAREPVPVSPRSPRAPGADTALSAGPIPVPSLQPLQPFCPPSIDDQGQPGSCLSASSVPTLGQLFPLGEFLFVDPSGKVGIGTLTPAVELEVDGPFQADGQNAGGGPHTAAVKGLGFPSGAQEVNGYLGVEGDADFDGVTTADWSGLEIGVAGIGKDSLPGDNYGVLGHSNGAGVRGEYSGNPAADFGELGLPGVGLRARGNTLAGEFQGDLEINDTGGETAPRLRFSRTAGGVTGSLGFTSNDLVLENESGGANVVLAQSGLLHVNDDADFATVRVDPGGTGALTSLWNGSQVQTIALDAHGGDGEGTIALHGASGTRTLFLEASESNTGAQISLDADDGTTTIEIDAEFGDGGGAHLRVRDALGASTITLDGQSGRTTTKILSITGGADIAEPFEASSGRLEPGCVAVIDPESPGRLRPSSEPYDVKIAGVASGAGGVSPGMTLSQPGTLADGTVPVALTGRVYVRCSAENGPIRPGDRLTSASLAGHAMKATDPARSDGAVLGKAMTALEEGTGLVLVLVDLQ